jgi:serine protease Do
MLFRAMKPALAVAVLGLLTLPVLAQESLDELQEKAIKAASKAVSPSIAQIETSGGADVISAGPRGGIIRKAAGPTTGVVVGADGYVISSAFNFSNKPSSIVVRIPGHKEGYVAEVVATDKTRMLTLLKVKGAVEKPFIVPVATPKKDIKIGITAIALGRTLDPGADKAPSLSVGIVSALGRIWGKAIQTDAKISPSNYGGPLIDLEGRVLGILIPASPQAEDENAGLEWYDSGIGFAVPLEEINAVLPRMRTGKDLTRGLLGVTFQGNDQFGAAPTIAAISPDSTASKADLKPGDIITEIDGKAVNNQAQVKHALGAKYDGEKISVKVLRGKETKSFDNLVMGGSLAAFGQAILGILPMRDDPELGVEVRYVLPKGPADTAGIKEGDRIMKIGPATGMGPLQAFSGRDHLASLLSSVPPGTKVKVEVVRADGKKTETLELTLGEVPAKGEVDEVVGKLPEKAEKASKEKAQEVRKTAPGMPPFPVPEKKAKGEQGLIARKTAAGTNDYWIYVPRNYDPNISYALVVWLHPVGKGKEKDITEDFLDDWISYCRDHNIIMACPASTNPGGWLAGESDVILEVVRDVMSKYTVDKRRVVAHGMGVGGQMAFYMGFHHRDVFRGVAVTGAALTTNAKDKVPNQPLAFFLHAGAKDPLAPAIADSKTKLIDLKYPVAYKVDPLAGNQYLDEKALEELVRWIDTLDRE